jgi:hypothetical protein
VSEAKKKGCAPIEHVVVGIDLDQFGIDDLVLIAKAAAVRVIERVASENMQKHPERVPEEMMYSQKVNWIGYMMHCIGLGPLSLQHIVEMMMQYDADHVCTNENCPTHGKEAQEKRRAALAEQERQSQADFHRLQTEAALRAKRDNLSKQGRDPKTIN